MHECELECVWLMEWKYHVAVSHAAFPRPDALIEAWNRVSRTECVKTLSRASLVMWVLRLKSLASLTLQSTDFFHHEEKTIADLI